MSTRDVTIIDSQPNEGSIAFIGGRVDATVPDYTDIKLLPRRVPGATAIVTGPDIGKAGGAPFRIFDLWVAPQKSFDANRDTIAGILRATSRWAGFVADPATHATAVDFVVEWGSKMSSKALVRADMEATLQGAHFFDAAGQKQIVQGGSLARALTNHAEFLHRLNLIKRVPDFDAAVDKTFW